MQKFKSGSLGGLQVHNERSKESRTNPDIDYTKTELNFDLVQRDGTYLQEARKNVGELKLDKAVRKDAVLACSFVITSDQEYFRGQAQETTKAFFVDSVKFFQDRYGEKNVFAATVHLDESTPHMHLLMTPIRDGRLSAKAIFNRAELQNLQTDFAREVGAKYGLERGREGSDKTHLTENRFKAEKALEAQKAAEKQLHALEPRILKASEVENMTAKKTFFGGLKGVSYAEFESLKKTALAVDKTRDNVKKAQTEISARDLRLKEQEKNLKDREKRLEQEKTLTPSALMLQQYKQVKAVNVQQAQVLSSVKSLFSMLLPILKNVLQPAQMQQVTKVAEKVNEVDRGQELSR